MARTPTTHRTGGRATMTHLSVYDGVKDTKGVSVTFDAVIDRIRNGGRGLDEKTRVLQILYQTDPKAYDREKMKLPAVTWAGTFPAYKRTGEHLNQHSGRVVLDIDNNIDLGTVLAELAQNPHVEFAFVSPSGDGVKPVIPVSPVPKNAAAHKLAFHAVLSVFSEYAEQDPEQLPKQRDPNRLCFLAYDPRAVYNPNAIPVEWDPEDQLPDEPTQTLDFQIDGSVDAYLQQHGITFNAAGQSQYFPKAMCPNDHDSNNKAVRFFHNEDGSINGFCNGCRSHWFLQPPKQRNRKPVKLHKNLVSMLTDTLKNSREFLKSVFENKKIKFFGLRADTGVGKNEGAINYYLRGVSGLLNVPTTDLAIEMEARLNAAEIDGVFRYRGILSNPDGRFPDESPCIKPLLYDALASRGWNAYELLCEPCEVRGLCEERGHRSQAERAKQAQVTVMPFPDIFLNPAFRTVAKDYLPTSHDDLSLHDEYDPYKFLEINLPKSRLVQMRDDWKGYDPSYFAKELLRILEVEGDLSQLRSLIDGLTDDARESLMEGFTSVMWNGQILSREDAHRCHDFLSASRSLETIGNLPRLETEDWNLIVQLELFFERYPRDADMPMKYENDTLTFYLPPLPMKTRARMGFMSATLDETAFRRAMDSRQIKRGDVTFHDTGLTEWHPEAKVFQLRTNRNPRATAYTPKGERVEGDLLSPSGEFYYGLVAEDLKNENRGLITYKALRQALEKEGCIRPSVQTANFGGLVGLDTRFKDVDVLHILFSPELPPSAVEMKAKMMFGNDTEPLCYDRDENGHYIDTRLQACYDDGVIAELLQAIGRGRLVSRPIIIVVWCSHNLPGITDRSQCFIFDEVDWEQADGDLEKLSFVVTEREAAEQSGDAHAYAEATGQSQSTAYRQTEQARRQSKADIDAERLQRILERKAQNIGEREIATQLGISYGKVRSLLKNAEVH
ncbi:MAG: hypothetical protein F4118_02370 [Acidimicrobiaceae bacterium]|nr:hypothetical protein [Acidimicrobiaceae bacterium]